MTKARHGGMAMVSAPVGRWGRAGEGCATCDARSSVEAELRVDPFTPCGALVNLSVLSTDRAKRRISTSCHLPKLSALHKNRSLLCMCMPEVYTCSDFLVH